jgi:hypothetical protein
VSGFWSIRRLTTGSILLTAAVGAVTLFGQTPPATSTVPAVVTSGPAMPPPTTIPSLDEPIAVINGRPINNRVFYSIMMQVAGMRVFQQVLDLTLVQGACQDAGLPLEGKDFDERLRAEADKYMTQLGIVGTTTKPMTFDERTSALGYVLQQRGISAVEFRISLETSALLRAMSAPNVKVSDDEVQTRYDSDYGERRRVHIVSYDPTNTATATVTVKGALATALKSGKTVEDACADLKLPQSAIAVWEIPSNAKDDKTVETIRNVAFNSLKAPKDISSETDVTGTNGQKQTVLVVLDEITPDRKAANSLTSKKDEVRQKVTETKQTQWMNNHLAFLRSKAVVEVKDQTLADMYKQVAATVQRAATQAATQPGGTGAAGATSPATTPAITFPPTATRPATGPATGRGSR